MRALIQRVSEARVTIDHSEHSSIGPGLLVLLGITMDDGREDVEWLVKKICHLRIFDDDNHVMNLSLPDVEGEVLVVSQFTLHAKTKKGNRPSYILAARPEQALPLYNAFISSMGKTLSKPIQQGVFGAKMMISLTNDGPVTLLIDTKHKE